MKGKYLSAKLHRRILALAGPSIYENAAVATCLDCGAARNDDTSPPYFDHTEDCRGVARLKAMAALLMGETER